MNDLKLEYISRADQGPLAPFRVQSQVVDKHLLILFDWMHEVLLETYKDAGRISLCLCIATGLVHRFLQRHDVALSRLQLLGATAVTVATKFEYGPHAHISLKTMGEYCDNIYVLDQLQDMEVSVLNAVDWSVLVSGPWSHIRPFLEMVLEQNGLYDRQSDSKDVIVHFEAMSLHLLHLVTFRTKLLSKHCYPMLAMCVAGMAACACGMEIWKSPLDHGYGLHPDRMVSAITDVQLVFDNALKKITRVNTLELCRCIGIKASLKNVTLPPTIIPMLKTLRRFDFSEYFA